MGVRGKNCPAPPWRYSALAIATALTLRSVFRLALRQTEGLIGSVIALLGLDLAVPDHTTLSRRAESLDVVHPRPGPGPVHLLVDSTGLKLGGSGEWLLEKHGTKTRPSWRKLHIAVDTDTGQIAVAALTTNDIDDASQVGSLLDQVDVQVASFTADGAYDQDGVYCAVVSRHPKASVIIPPRSSAVPSETAQTAPTLRDLHLQIIAERGRMAWQKASGYNWRVLVEADVSRFKRVIGDGLRSRTDGRRATEVTIAVSVLNRMLEPRSMSASRNGETTWLNCGRLLIRATQSPGRLSSRTSADQSGSAWKRAPARTSALTNSRASRLSSVTSAASGQPIPAAAARPRYSRTVLGAMPSSRPIARVLAPAPKCNPSNCRIRRMDSLCVGIPPLHRLRWRHWKPGQC
ncbi:MAG: IS5 family transposase [Acetobacteraceae bacterium]